MFFNEPPNSLPDAGALQVINPPLDLPDERTDTVIMQGLGLTDATLPYYQELFGVTSPMCQGLYERTVTAIFERARLMQSYPSFALANALLDETNQGLTTLTDNTLIAMRVVFYAHLADQHGIQLQVDMDLSEESVIKLMTACAVLLPSIGQQLADVVEYQEWRQTGQFAARTLKSLMSSVAMVLRSSSAPAMRQERVMQQAPVARGLSSPMGMARQGPSRGLAFSGSRSPVKKPTTLSSVSKTSAAGLSKPPEGGLISKPAAPAARSSLLTQNLSRSVNAARAPVKEAVAKEPVKAATETTSVLDHDLRQEYHRRIVAILEKTEAKKSPKGMTLAQITRKLGLEHIWSILDLPNLKWADEIPLSLFDVNTKECLLVPPATLAADAKPCVLQLNRGAVNMNPESYFTLQQSEVDEECRQPRIRGTEALSNLAIKKPAERREDALVKVHRVSETPLVVSSDTEAMGMAQQYSRVCGLTICAQRYLTVDIIPLREGELDALSQLRTSQTIYDLHNSLSGLSSSIKRNKQTSYLVATVARRMVKEINDFLKYGCGSTIRIDSFMHPSVQQLIKVVRQAKPLVGEALTVMQASLIERALRSVNDQLLRVTVDNFPEDSDGAMVAKLFGADEATDTRLGTGFINEGTMLYIDLTAADIGLPLFIPTLNKRNFYLELNDDLVTVQSSQFWTHWLSCVFGPFFKDEDGDHQLRVRLADGSEFMVRRTAIVLGDSRTLVFTAL